MAAKMKMNVSPPSWGDVPEPLAYLEVVKVVRESVPVVGGGTLTIGEMVDGYLADCAKDNTEVQELHLEFSAKQWENFKISLAPKAGEA